MDRGQLQNHEQAHVRWKRINMGGYKRHSQRPMNKSHIKAEGTPSTEDICNRQLRGQADRDELEGCLKSVKGTEM